MQLASGVPDRGEAELNLTSRLPGTTLRRWYAPRGCWNRRGGGEESAAPVPFGGGQPRPGRCRQVDGVGRPRWGRRWHRTPLGPARPPGRRRPFWTMPLQGIDCGWFADDGRSRARRGLLAGPGRTATVPIHPRQPSSSAAGIKREGTGWSGVWRREGPRWRHGGGEDGRFDVGGGAAVRVLPARFPGYEGGEGPGVQRAGGNHVGVAGGSRRWLMAVPRHGAPEGWRRCRGWM